MGDNSQYQDKKLAEWQERVLLEQIERSGKSPPEFDFIELCRPQRSWPLYGPPNSNRRTLYRYRLKYWRSLTVENYVKRLARINIEPAGQTNKRLIAETTGALATLPITPSSVQPILASPVLQPEKKDKDETTLKPPPQEQEDADDGTEYSSSTMSDFQTPQKKPSGSEWDAAVPDFASPDRVGSAVGFSPTPIKSTKEGPVLKWKTPEQGTKEDPFVIYMDPTQAHSIREFNVSFIPMKRVKGFRRNCIHI
jgi:hypothetical protein